MASRVRALHPITLLVEDLQVDAAAEFLDKVRDKERVSVSTEANGQGPVPWVFKTYTMGLAISLSDLSLP
jgi:hypothetical protein